MKRVLALVFTLCLLVPAFSMAANVEEIGEIEINKRLLDGDDEIRILAIEDPDNPFITLYLTSIHAGKLMDTSAPSDSSLAARITGEIPRDRKGNPKIATDTELNLFKLSKSIGFKKLRIARHFDRKRNVLIYTAYSKKVLEGSFKHSMSVVPIRD